MSTLVVVFAALFLQGAGHSSVGEVFVGDFEVGSPGWQQFTALQYEEDRPVEDSFAIVSEPVRQGSHAARITVRQGYSKFGHSEDTSLVLRGGEQDGDEYWYAWSTLFPRDWRAPHGWGVFTEWHSNLGTSAIIGFYAWRDSAEATLLSGTTDEARNSAAVDRVVPLLATLSKGRWNDFVMHVRWSRGDDGFLEIFHRVAGERSLRKVISFRGVPTFQVTADGRGHGAYMLWGLYRGSYCPQPTQLDCVSPRGVQPPHTLYHDGLVRAPTYGVAASRAFPGPIPKLPAAQSNAVQQHGMRVAPIPVRATTRPAGVVREKGCSATAAAPGRVVARIAAATDDRDTAVVSYRLRQRTAVVIRERLTIDARRLTGRLVVTELQTKRGNTLAQLYIGPEGTLRLSSPRGALRPQGFDVDTGLAGGPGADARTVELRLTKNELLFMVDGGSGYRLIARMSDIEGPRRGAVLSARIGLDRYDGRAGGQVRAVYDNVVVGVA